MYPNWIEFPVIVIDEMMKDMTVGELRLMLFILRDSWGRFRPTTLDYTNGQLSELINLREELVAKTIAILQDKNLIRVFLRPNGAKAFNVLTEEPKPESDSKLVKNQKDNRGFVYVIKSDSGFYKIGKSVNAQKRIEELGVKLPFPIEPIHIIESNDYTRAEMYFHQKFADKRGNGEWFALTDEDIEYLKGITFWEIK